MSLVWERCIYIPLFKPQEFDRDIYIRQASGRGGGGGFDHGPDISVLGDDEFTPKIMDRCIDLLRLFIEEDILTEAELMKELKIGVSMKGTDQVIPYEEFIKTLSNREIRLRQQLRRERSRRPLVRPPDEYKEKYEELVKKLESKKKVEDLLRYLHKELGSTVKLDQETWILCLYEVKAKPVDYLWAQMKALTNDERKMLEDRIETHHPIMKNLFEYMKDKPTLKTVTDELDYYFPFGSG
jgi:hypothetical protein